MLDEALALSHCIGVLFQQSVSRIEYRLYNPLRQNYTHVKAVKRFLSLPDRYVFSVVAFVGSAKIKTKRKLPSNVVYLSKLRSYIRTKREKLLSAREVGSISQKLKDHQAGLKPAIRSPHLTAVNAEPACPECNAKMVKRTATRGARVGKKFWGCPNYPNCTGIRNI